MKVYLAFQATATQITGLYLQSGGASKTETLPVAITRGDGIYLFYFLFDSNKAVGIISMYTLETFIKMNLQMLEHSTQQHFTLSNILSLLEP